MPKLKKETFFSRNLIAIVMIPSLIGIHYGWSVMQRNRTLVTEDEQIDLPAVTFAKYVWRQLTGASESAEVNAADKATAAAK